LAHNQEYLSDPELNSNPTTGVSIKLKLTAYRSVGISQFYSNTYVLRMMENLDTIVIKTNNILRNRML
jgi:hypothetical protein